jgi:hypothetical protein
MLDFNLIARTLRSLYNSRHMFTNKKRFPFIAVFLLLIMSFTHGGGSFIASKCISPVTKNHGKTILCTMNDCPCRTGGACCMMQLHRAPKGVAILTNPDCSPLKKILPFESDTTHFVLGISEKVRFTPSHKSLPPHHEAHYISSTLSSIFRPPQA